MHCGFSHHTALVSWLISLLHMPATASKVLQLDYGSLQTKNDTRYNAKGRNETSGSRGPLVPFPQGVQG